MLLIVYLENKTVEWKKVLRTILERRHVIGHIMGEVCEKRHGRIIIYDNPMKIEIREREVCFLIEDEIAGILTEKGLEIINNQAEKEIEYWCVALSSPGFKRYSIKRKCSQNISSLE